MLFENNSYDFDVLSLAGFNFDNSSQHFETYDKLVSTKEGFTRGNMFKNEYVPYKNMQPIAPKATCEREVFKFIFGFKS